MDANQIFTAALTLWDTYARHGNFKFSGEECIEYTKKKFFELEKEIRENGFQEGK